MTTTTDKGAPQVPALLSRRAAARMAAAAPATPPPAQAPVAAAASKQASEARMAAIQADARSRVAAAWTLSKTLLPSLNHEAKMAFARALCSAPTALLAEGLRATARMASFTKAAEKFETETGRDLNEFVESEGELSKLQNQVLDENKADAPKLAAAGKKAGPEEDKRPVEAPAEVPPAVEPPAAGTPEGTPDAPTGDFADPAPAGDAAPGEMGDGGAGVDDPAPANEAMDAATEGSLMDSIQAVEGQISTLEEEVQEAGEEALDLAAIFNPEVQADKAQNLANEEHEDDPDLGEVDFSPSSTEDMQDATDFGAPDEAKGPQDFFKDASGPDPLSALLNKHASEDVDVPMGGMAEHFESDLAGDDRDAESDNEDLLGEVLSSIEQPTMDQKRDTEPNLEEPAAPQSKEARRTAAQARARVQSPVAPAKSSIRSVGSPTPRMASADITDAEISSLILQDDF